MADASSRYALLAQFESPADILRAAALVRAAGYRRWDVFTPFPVHGMDEAMGLKKSQVGWFTFLFGATGLTLGYLMIWWMNAYDYLIIVGGKRGDMSRRPRIELFPDMDRQPKLRPQTANSFFKDGLSSQPLVAGTIARGSTYEDSPENTGKIHGTTNWVETIPVAATQQLL